MYLDNVYTGFTKDGKERCLKKLHKTLYTDNGDVYVKVYLDLESNEEFEPSMVDENNMKPITDLIGEKKWKTKRKVVKFYKFDRSIQLDPAYTFYGNIIYKLWNVYTKSFNVSIYKKDVLMARVDDQYGKVMDVKRSKFYFEDSESLTGFLAQEVRPINYIYTETGTIEKRKLLEMDYKKEL